MAGTTSDWEGELGRWLKPFLDRLGHKARRQICPLYVAAPHLNRRYQQSGTPSSISSFDQVLSDVRTAEPGSARNSGMNKSAKVVLTMTPLEN
jgi:hypothetical protein